MKKSDILFFLFVIALFLPFFISDTIYEWYKSFNAIHGMVMSFVKFAILATLGEMLGLRISTGVYHNKTFGIIPRMVIWGVLGMGINMAMIIFSKGTPIFLEYMGLFQFRLIICQPFRSYFHPSLPRNTPLINLI